MKWLLLGCFLGNQRPHAKHFGRSQTPATVSSPVADTGAATRADTRQGGAALNKPQEPGLAATGPSRPEAVSETRNRACGASTCDDGSLSSLAQPDSGKQISASHVFSEQQEAPAPRLSLDCGVGIGPSPPDPPPPPLPPSSNLSFSPICLVACGSVDTASADMGVESSIPSEGSSGALIIRGGGTAVLAMPPADTNNYGSRHLVSRALRGRASLDALLMLGALVRAADEAGLAVTGVGSTPRLERIESGDLPTGEDGHQDKQFQARTSRTVGGGAVRGEARPEWCADAEGAAGPRQVQRPQRRGLRLPQPVWVGASNGGVCGAGAGGGCGSNGWIVSSGAMGNGGAGAGVAPSIATFVTALGRACDPEFTFSQPALASSLRQSIDNNSKGQHSDMILSQHPPAQLNSQTQGLGGQVADSNQILELFMRLVTNCSTVGDNDLPSSSCGGDRSSAGTTYTGGTAQGSRVLVCTDAAQQIAAAGVGMGGATVAGAGAPTTTASHRKVHGQRGVSERPRTANGRRWDYAAAIGVPAPVVAGPSPAAAAAMAAAAASSALKHDDGGSSAPLLMLHGNLLIGNSRGDGSRGGRRNSWDTLAGSSGSAVAVAAAAAAALAAAGLLRGSLGSHTTTMGGTFGAGGCSNSSRTGSATRFWPTGSPLHEDSGPASMLLLGALSGGMSLGGNTSGASLVQLPTGSGSVRDVLSRIHQQQQQLLTLQEGGPAVTSSSSWSTQTGLASLFDAHLTAALRRNGAVRNFKRALGGPATLSHTSSATSQVTGNLGRQDTSLTLTSGLMMLNLGSTAGSSAAGGIGSGAGVSQLGAASAATAAAAAAGIIVNGLPPPHVHRGVTISSISTINSSPEAGGGGGGGAVGMAAQRGIRGEGIGGGSGPAREGAFEGTTRRHYGYQVSLTSDDGTSQPPQLNRAQLPRQLRAYVERQGVVQQHHRLHHHYHYHLPRRHPHYEEHSQGQQQQQQEEESEDFQQIQSVQPDVPSSQVFVVSGSSSIPAPRGTVPTANGLPGYEERCSLSLALGLAAGLHGAGIGTGAGAGAGGASAFIHPPLAAAAAGCVPDGATTSAANHDGCDCTGQLSPCLPPSAEVLLTARSIAAGALMAGPVGSAWLQPTSPPPPPPEPRCFPHATSELSTSLDFSRYSWETDWGPPARNVERGDTFTFTGPESSFSHLRSRADSISRETGGSPGVSG